jgi:excisionase family DNA binding protein
MESLYKPEEVAEKLKVSVSYIYKNAELGNIKHKKLGSSLRFSEKNISDYINKCEGKR